MGAVALVSARAPVSMHIVIIAWLFITFTMALTMRPVGGTMFFGFAGLLPVVLLVALALRRRRAARRAMPTARTDEPRVP